MAAERDRRATRRPAPGGPLIGTHVSIAGGISRAPQRGQELRCTAIQIFDKSNNQWRAAPLPEEEVRAFRRNLRASGVRRCIAHTSYLINLASPDAALAKRSLESFVEELERCERLGLPSLVVHPGSHVGEGESAGIRRVARSLRRAIDRTAGFRVRALLETTAGQGTNLGRRFEELARILDRTERPERTGVCVDTCHVHAAGYDLRTEPAYRATLQELDAVVGLRQVRAFHLNDSKTGLGSRVDRHESIGRGKIGRLAFRLLLADRRFRNVPMVLETPKGTNGELDRKNLAMLRRLIAAGRRVTAR